MFFSLPRSTCHSLAEVQVMGGSVDSLRFSEVDYSGAYNNFGGWYNAPNISNENAFAICASKTPRRD
jgi:hypothetical protein